MKYIHHTSNNPRKFTIIKSLIYRMATTYNTGSICLFDFILFVPFNNFSDMSHVKFSYCWKSIFRWNSAIMGLVYDNILEPPYFLSNETLTFFSNFALTKRLKIGV